MYFTTSILTLALGLTGVQAMAFNKRQTGIASAQLFTDSSCQSAPVGNFDFVDDGNSCKPTNFPATVKSIRINLNGATRPLHIYDRFNCTANGQPAGHYITYGTFPDNMGCQGQMTGLNSYNFGPVLG